MLTPAMGAELRYPVDADRILIDACDAAASAAAHAWMTLARTEREREVRIGADGTPTMLIDQVVEDAIIAVANRHRINLLSEEVGFVDVGSARTLVVDPLDGSANAAAGVPLSCFSGAIVEDGVPVEALTCWLEGGAVSWARAGELAEFQTSSRRPLKGSALSMLRPKTGPRGDSTPTWLELCDRAGRIRVLSTSCLEAMLVADGSIDAFVDPGSETHRIVDLVAAMVLVPAAGGWVQDGFGRELEISTDLTMRFSGVVAATRALADEISEIVSVGAGDESLDPVFAGRMPSSTEITA